MHMTYAIKFVADMDAAVAFHRDRLGLTLKFQSPGWSEFATGETTLALHAASAENPAGSVQLGFTMAGLDDLYQHREARGVSFTQPPHDLHGSRLARIRDGEGAEYSLSGARATDH